MTESVWLNGDAPTEPTDRETRKAIQAIVALERLEPLEDWEGINMVMQGLLYGTESRLNLLKDAISAWFAERRGFSFELLKRTEVIAIQKGMRSMHPGSPYQMDREFKGCLIRPPV